MKFHRLVLVVILSTSVSMISTPAGAHRAQEDNAKAKLHNAEGQPVGMVWLTQQDDVVIVRAKVYNLPPGFHGFHIHQTGTCDPPFTSAGGHIHGNTQHPHGAGDMPVLLVNGNDNDNGTGKVTFETDRFSIADLFDDDGSAIIVHANPDNYANIPLRYAPKGPDETTLNTGDGGDRIACGVIKPVKEFDW